jgi:hypothetical protein
VRSQHYLSILVLTLYVASWGESAGGMSVGFHLLVDNGESGGLFTGGIMVYFLRLMSSLRNLTQRTLAIRFPNPSARCLGWAGII